MLANELHVRHFSEDPFGKMSLQEKAIVGDRLDPLLCARSTNNCERKTNEESGDNAKPVTSMDVHVRVNDARSHESVQTAWHSLSRMHQEDLTQGLTARHRSNITLDV